LAKAWSFIPSFTTKKPSKYLFEMLDDTTPNYKKIAFINTKTGTISEDRKSARKKAKEQNWEFKKS
jgi:hypothetical protein